MKNTKVLFLCKDRGYGTSYGLFLSAKFVALALESKDVPSKVVSVIDGNSINREVSQYKPTHVVFEALWVTPEKIRELVKLHPLVKWVVRVHSEIPFIAYEGIAFEWMFKYQTIHNTWVASNSKVMSEDLKKVQINALYLPNIYFPAFSKTSNPDRECCKGRIDIGCFGAIRPLKNQLEQAVAAITFANKNDKKLRFHINASRTEQSGNSVLKNIQYLFKGNVPHELVEHDWVKHEEFVDVVRRMDLGMQVSFSETFNIVTADFVNNNIPIVVSEEVSWMPTWTKAKTTDIDDIVETLENCYNGRRIWIQRLNKICLCRYNKRSLDEWMSYL